jgi:hypothetical protein
MLISLNVLCKVNSKLIHKCNHISSRFNTIKEESSIASDDVFYSFLSGNRTLHHHSVSYESEVLGN